MDKRIFKNIIIGIITLGVVSVLAFLIFDNLNKENNEDADKKELDYVRTTQETVVLDSVTDEYLNISIEAGKLKGNTLRYIDNEELVLDDSYISSEVVYSLDNEEIKYIHYDYYQPSNTNVIFILTNLGNIYVNEFFAQGESIDVIKNFTKMNYQDVKDLIKVPNKNYNKADEYGMIDYREYYIYALIGDGEIKIDNQYAK